VRRASSHKSVCYYTYYVLFTNTIVNTILVLVLYGLLRTGSSHSLEADSDAVGGGGEEGGGRGEGGGGGRGEGRQVSNKKRKIGVEEGGGGGGQEEEEEGEDDDEGGVDVEVDVEVPSYQEAWDALCDNTSEMPETLLQTFANIAKQTRFLLPAACRVSVEEGVELVARIYCNAHELLNPDGSDLDMGN
jgi:hypothetical protein